MTTDLNTDLADLTRRAKSVSLNINPHATSDATASEYVGWAASTPGRLAVVAERLSRTKERAALAFACASVSVEITSAVDNSRTLYGLCITHGEKSAVFYGSDLAAVMAAARARLDTYEAELPKLADMVARS